VTAVLVVDALLLAWLIFRQRRIRRVPRHLGLRVAALLVVLGLVEVAAYSRQHPLHPAVTGVLALSLAVAAVGLGVVRALTVRLRVVEGRVLQKGTWLTVALWLISLGLHFAAGGWIIALKGPGGLPSASLLLYVGLTYGTQRAVVHRRAVALAGRLGPIDAEAVDLRGGSQTCSRPTGEPGPIGISAQFPPDRSAPGAIQAIEARSEVVERAPAHPAGSHRDHPPAPEQRRR